MCACRWLNITRCVFVLAVLQQCSWAHRVPHRPLHHPRRDRRRRDTTRSSPSQMTHLGWNNTCRGEGKTWFIRHPTDDIFGGEISLMWHPTSDSLCGCKTYVDLQKTRRWNKTHPALHKWYANGETWFTCILWHPKSYTPGCEMLRSTPHKWYSWSVKTLKLHPQLYIKVT